MGWLEKGVEVLVVFVGIGLYVAVGCGVWWLCWEVF